MNTGKEYICVDFDFNSSNECSHGYYATGIDGIIYSFVTCLAMKYGRLRSAVSVLRLIQFKRRYERIKLVRQFRWRK